jgi:hypothetical protein
MAERKPRAAKKPVKPSRNGNTRREQVRRPPHLSPAEERPARKTQPRQKRRWKVPTTVLVTLLVALLSVAVGPAVTRQWDDRQKARQLQVELIELVWSTTADIQGELRSLGYSSRRDPWPVRDSIFDEWEISRQAVETKLRVYYGEEGVRAWRSYVLAVKGLAVLAAYEAATPDGRLWQTAAAEPVCIGECTRPEPNEYVRRIIRPGETRVHAADAIAIFRRPQELQRKMILGSLSRLLADQASTVVDLILRKGPRGFSTTRSDLLHDLLP